MAGGRMALPTSQSGEAFPPRPAFACTVEHRARHVVVSLRGELDLAAAPELRHRVLELMALPVDRVTVDMAALTFIDSSGLHALTAAHHAAAEHHVDLV